VSESVNTNYTVQRAAIARIMLCSLHLQTQTPGLFAVRCSQGKVLQTAVIETIEHAQINGHH
jgi:hypothetical protein